MTGDYYEWQAINEIGVDGVIDGGVIGTWGEGKRADDFLAWNAFPRNQAGPTTGPAWFSIDNVFLSHNTKVWFNPLLDMLPGFFQVTSPPGTPPSLANRVELVMWLN